MADAYQPGTRPTPPSAPPYYAVIFTSRRPPAEGDDGYAATAAVMEQLAAASPGFLGIDSARGPDGFGVTVSYWRDERSVAEWRAQVDHEQARRLGRERWYESFAVHVARVERSYGFDR